MVDFKGELTGSSVPYLVDLVDRGLISILDVSFIRREADGTVVALNLDDLDLRDQPDLAMFEGASSGLLGETDTRSAGAAMEPDSSAVLLVSENVWIAPFAASVRRAGGELRASGRIPTQAIIAQLDALDAAEADPTA